MEITFEGGSGKATILSPVKIKAEGGAVTATVQWDSPNYDYMIVDGTKSVSYTHLKKYLRRISSSLQD